MFDRYIAGRTPAYPQHVTVTEQRAPTDESVRLLREMEAKAMAQVLKTVHVSNTPVEFVMHRMEDAYNDETIFRCVFKLNGVVRTVEYRYRDGLDGARSAETIARGIVDAVAKDIATLLVVQTIKRVPGLL